MIKVIAGSRRGKTLRTLEGLDTRPTANRVREALFNIVQFDLPGAVVLDLFAGSGALAIESLSRGARRVILCDASRQASDIISANLKSCGFEAELFRSDFRVCLKTLANRNECFNIIFLDPPYAMAEERNLAVELIFEGGLLAENGYLVLETEVSQELQVPTCAEIFDERRYGKTKLSRIRRRSLT